MFVQDDQIRFAARDQSGAAEEEMQHARARPSLGRCRVQGFGLPWHIVRVGSAGGVDLLLSVLFPFWSRCDVLLLLCVVVVDNLCCARGRDK